MEQNIKSNPIDTINYNHKYLVIDGNYFGHRLIHGIRISKPDFNLDSSVDQINFNNALNDGLLNLYKSFNNQYHRLIDNIIFVFDHSSWRKEVDYFRPYYISENSPEKLGYKDNRGDLKEASSINWDNFDKCLNGFKDRIKNNIPIINFKGAEGDDNLFLLSEEFKNKDILMLVFCTDGDLATLVNDNTIIIKNVKSKISPSGEIVVSKNIYDFMFKQKSILETMLGSTNTSTKDYFETLFKIDVSNGGSVRSNITRKQDDNIYSPNKHKDLLCKVICGDKKDNIFPIIRWEKNGKNYKCTEAMLKKAFESVDFMDFDEENVTRAMNDNKLMSQVLVMLADNCGVSRENLKQIGAHYRHNLMLNSLSDEHIPNHVKTDFKMNFSQIENLVYRSIDDAEIFGIGLNTSKHDSAKDLITTSIPTSGGNVFNDIMGSNFKQ